MWIGTNSKFIKFKDPAVGVGDNRMGFGASGVFLHGGGWAYNSPNAAKRLNLNWPFLRADQVATLRDAVMHQHVIDVWIATEYEVNMLSPQCAAPGLYCDESLRVDTPANGLELPGFGKRFTKSETYRVGRVPSGAKFKAWGSGTITVGGTSYTMSPVTRDATVITLPANTFISVVVPSGATVYGMIGTIDWPLEKKWKSGMGSSGYRLTPDSGFQVVQYSAPEANNYYSVSLNFIETGDWDNVLYTRQR